MGGRRKKETVPSMETFQRNPCANCSVTARNLRTNDLGGVILGCTRHTIKECLSNQLFGLPAGHFAYVKKIRPGLPLFLFNYSDRQLHGIYEAASSGEMNINPYGWSEDGQEPTKYPAQVHMLIRKQCKALSETQYKTILIDNYYAEDHLWFELDHVQTRRLIRLFESSPVAKPKQALIKHDKKVKSERVPEVKARQAKVLSQYPTKWDVLRDMDSEEDDAPSSESGSSSSAPFVLFD
ncbi:hypothetical protein MKW94_018324 [Papaver nudicaule]|uniref:DCD domain-containing protein n=1 Tax=Papaver nudicaule TaxID=74823 RepID=A0AA41V514_PAPNU|nr:hypothetical protein [Papaver nudicaule]